MKIPRINRITLFLFYLMLAIWSLFKPKSTVFLLEAHKEKYLRDAEERSRKRRFGGRT